MNTDPQPARPAIWQWLIVAVALVLIGGVAYYGLKVVRANAFNDDRAFRVLTDIGEQIGNLELSRATTLATMPAITNVPPCPPHPATLTRPSESDTDVKRYLAKLDLFQPRVCKGTPRPKLAAAGKRPPVTPRDYVSQVCDEASLAADNETVIRLFDTDHGLQAAIVSCQTRYSLQEVVDDAADYFVGQTFFDSTVLARADGTVISELARQRRSTVTPRVDLHPATAQKFNLTNVADILRASQKNGKDEGGANTEENSDADLDQSEKKDPSASASSPVKGLTGRRRAFDFELGNRTYRLYVLPITLPVALLVETNTGPVAARELKRESLVYLIGIQRIDVSGSVQRALWPHGTLGILICSLLALLAWPLLTLALEPIEESIAWRKVVVCIVAVLLVPAALALAVGSWWSLTALNAWLGHMAQEYAAAIEDRLHTELEDGVRQLTATRGIYDVVDHYLGASSDKCTLSLFEDARFEKEFFKALESPIPIRFENGQAISATAISGEEGTDGCMTIQLEAQKGKHNWSTLRNIIALDSAGNRFGPMLTTFGTVPVRKSIQLADRPYFQRLQRGQVWVMGSGEQALPFVAQRLFNRSDGSRALQIAVPLCKASPDTWRREFCGIITGDSRMHTLVASIAPPLLQFAVIDQATGTVLFHSDDRRSLAENFYRETEENEALRAAIRTAQPVAFGGEYLGNSHGFYYRPLRDAPWGVVTFYPRKELDDLSLHAAFAVVSTYGGAVFGLMLIASAMAWLWGSITGRQGTRVVLRTLWPSIGQPGTFNHALWRWRPSLVAAVALITLIVWDRPAKVWIVYLAILLAIAVAFVPALLRRIGVIRTRSAEPGQDVRVSAAIEYLVSVVIAVAILPVLGLFFVYHDLQVAGLMREGLVDAAYDMQERYAVIRRDLSRWVPPGGHVPRAEPEDDEPKKGKPPAKAAKKEKKTQEADKGPSYPNAQAVLALQEQTYFGRANSPYDKQPWSRRTPNLAPNAVESAIWRATAGSSSQLRRLEWLVPAKSVPARVECHWQPADAEPITADRCTVRGDDGSVIAVKTPIAQAAIAARWSWSSVSLVTATLICLALWFSAHWFVRFLSRRLFGFSSSYLLTPPAADDRPLLTIAADDTMVTIEKKLNDVWKRLGPEEQLLLYDLALGEIPNPRHDSVIRSLIRKGMVKVLPWPVLIDERLAPFIRIAEQPKRFAAWREQAASSPWRSIRLPLFIVVILIVAWLNYAAGGTMKAFSALLIGTIAFLTQITQLFGFARGANTASKTGA